MALKVKAVERLLKFDKDSAGEYRYVMKPEMYSTLSQAKVIREAALRSGVNQGVMQACWDAAGEVIKAWATEGHSVALPGLGTMRFGVRSKAVEELDDVKTGLKESPHHLHSKRGSEGRVSQHLYRNHLLRPKRQRGEACNLYLWRSGRQR